MILPFFVVFASLLLSPNKWSAKWDFEESLVST
jgi:hypothetical protein